MSFARQPESEPPKRPNLRLVPSRVPDRLPENAAVSGSPARGIMWGVLLSVAFFWAPLAAAAGWLTSR